MRLLRLRALSLACLVLASGALLAACGDEEPGIDEPAREGLALELGGVDYNVFLTRQINPKIAPDSAYYDGPAAKPGSTFYGVFVQACNLTERSLPTAEEFTIEDNQGNEFHPEELPEENEFAYHPGRLQPDQCIPEDGSVADLGPTAGSMLLFELPLDVTENRPLELKVLGPPAEVHGHDELTFELDI